MTKTQIDISKKIIIKKMQRHPRLIAGVDVGINDDLICGFIAVMSLPTLEYIDGGYAVEKIDFPYIPNFLAFREIPVIVRAYSKLKNKPDLIFVDGQGIAHPRFCGIAAHLGVLLNKPTIGCAKSYLFGEWRMPGKKRGDLSPIEYAHKRIGIVLRTRDNTKPLFVSPGNLVSFYDCRKYVLATAKYRIPEPIRCAHINAREVLRRVINRTVKGVECLK